MPGPDLVLWLPWALLLSAGAAVLAVRSVRRGDGVGALAWTGWALAPPALLLTGTLRLVGRVGGAVLDWAAALAFTPTTWLGLLLAAASAVLLGGARVLRRRGRGASARVSSADPVRPPGTAVRGAGRVQGGAGVDADLAEVEEILRRRGIG